MVTLETAMNVAKDSDRMSRKDLKNAKARARRAAAKAATVMNAELAEAARKAPKAVKAKPVKVTVKAAVLDLFFSKIGQEFSTADAVSRLQDKHKGMNESSIRVWVSDFVKDGTIKVARVDGRQNILKAGKLAKAHK